MRSILQVLCVVFVMCCLNACSHVNQETAQKLDEPPFIQEESMTSSSSNQVVDEYVEKIDPTIEFHLLTEETAKEFGAEKSMQDDPGFLKWIVTFHQIPGDAPYSLQEKRIAQSDLEAFEPLKGEAQEFRILKAKIYGEPFHVVVSSRGYLPGEKYD